ncbi:MAG: hypothetical protein OXC13_03895 [Caldilineaceae bacterium]|nr:hypothetical protein [Caldilineaceae bacterium]
MQAAGTPTGDEPELRRRTVNDVVEEIRARHSGFSATDSLPRKTSYNRGRAHREGREADAVEPTGQVQG